MTDILWHNQTLFRNSDVFDSAYVPENFEHRGGQLQTLANCIKPALNGLKPTNCKIIGKTATGKTTSIKIIFEEAEKESSKIIFCHANCSLHHSLYALFSHIHKTVVGHTPPSSGFPFKEVFSAIMKKLQNEKKILIIALDDAVYSEQLNKVVYDLLRACEQYSVKIGVWLIGLPNELFQLDSKTLSIFSPQTITYPDYTREEIESILKKRAEYGFYPGVAQNNIISKIAQESLKKDLRFAIELLKSSAIEAENQSKKIIEHIHVIDTLRKFNTEEKSNEKISEKENKILSQIEKNGNTSGELFEKVKDELSYTSFYRFIEKLNQKGLINIEERTQNGRTRFIKKI